MKYKVRNNHNSKAVKEFDNLESAISWCDKHITKYGHRVTHVEGCCIVTDYDTAKIAMDRTNAKLEANIKRGKCL